MVLSSSYRSNAQHEWAIVKSPSPFWRQKCAFVSSRAWKLIGQRDDGDRTNHTYTVSPTRPLEFVHTEARRDDEMGWQLQDFDKFLGKIMPGELRICYRDEVMKQNNKICALVGGAFAEANASSACPELAPDKQRVSGG
jgi:hypothetical protein